MQWNSAEREYIQGTEPGHRLPGRTSRRGAERRDTATPISHTRRWDRTSGTKPSILLPVACIENTPLSTPQHAQTQETRTEKKTFPGGLFLPTPISGTQWSAECGEDASELSVNGLALGTVSYLITHPPPGPCSWLPTFRRSTHVIFSEGLLCNLKPYLTHSGWSATLALERPAPASPVRCCFRIWTRRRHGLLSFSDSLAVL